MTLERTYRWLLACYPREHRRQYEDEMLGVLLDDAGQRRRPGVRDVLDLLTGALRAHVRHLASGPDERWRATTAAFGLLASLAMLAYSARTVILVYGSLPGDGWLSAWQPWDVWPRFAAWALVALTAAAGLRRIAAVLAWVAVALEMIIAFGGFDLSIIFVGTQLWTFTLAVVTALALTVPAPRPGAAVLGWRRTAMLAAAGLAGVAGAATGVLSKGGVLGLTMGWSFTRTTHPAEPVLDAIGFALGAACLLSLPAALRRRVLALLAPVAVTVLVNRYALYDRVFPGLYGITSPPSLAQSLALVGIPLLTFAVAVAVVHRRDRTAHLLNLGMAADRRS
jgi:hypothetical protein